MVTITEDCPYPSEDSKLRKLAAGVARALIYVSGDPRKFPDAAYVAKINALVNGEKEGMARFSSQLSKRLDAIGWSMRKVSQAKELPEDGVMACYHALFLSVASEMKSPTSTALVLLQGQIHAGADIHTLQHLCDNKNLVIDPAAYHAATLAASTRQDLAPLANIVAKVSGRSPGYKEPMRASIGICPFVPNLYAVEKVFSLVSPTTTPRNPALNLAVEAVSGNSCPIVS